jgi:uncharacterized membrane protein YtjA (UPF0391 family)
MSVVPKEGERARRRWSLLVLAGAAGFVGRGGFSATPGMTVMLLLVLFVVVFLVALGLSVLRDAPVIDPVPEHYPDPSQVQSEAVYGSP